MNLNGGMRVIKQSATAWGVADYCALIGIIFGWGFWTNLYLALYIPTTLSAQLVTIIGAGLHAFAMPVLWSALLPTTAAGQLLQKTKHRTIGFAAVVCFALFLTVIAAYLMYAWQSAQVNVKNSGLAYYMTIIWMILTVGVPALAFVQVTPEQWLKQVEQWQMVQRLELHHKTELILAREAYGRAMIILRLGLDRATLEQRQYVAGVWSGLHKAEQYNLRAIAETLHDDGLSAQAIDPDAGEIGAGISRIALAIEQTADQSDAIMSRPIDAAIARERSREPVPVEVYAEPLPRSTVPHSNAETGDTRTIDRGPQRAAAGGVAVERERSREADEPDKLAKTLGVLVAAMASKQAWMRRDVEHALSIEKTKAGDIINDLLATGVIEKITNPSNHYQFTDYDTWPDWAWQVVK